MTDEFLSPEEQEAMKRGAQLAPIVAPVMPLAAAPRSQPGVVPAAQPGQLTQMVMSKGLGQVDKLVSGDTTLAQGGEALTKVATTGAEVAAGDAAMGTLGTALSSAAPWLALGFLGAKKLKLFNEGTDNVQQFNPSNPFGYAEGTAAVIDEEELLRRQALQSRLGNSLGRGIPQGYFGNPLGVSYAPLSMGYAAPVAAAPVPSYVTGNKYLPANASSVPVRVIPVQQSGGDSAQSEPSNYQAPSGSSLYGQTASALYNYGTAFGGWLPLGFAARGLGQGMIDADTAKAAREGGKTEQYYGNAAFGVDGINNLTTEAQTKAAIEGRPGGGPLSGAAWGTQVDTPGYVSVGPGLVGVGGGINAMDAESDRQAALAETLSGLTNGYTNGAPNFSSPVSYTSTSGPLSGNAFSNSPSVVNSGNSFEQAYGDGYSTSSYGTEGGVSGVGVGSSEGVNSMDAASDAASASNSSSSESSSSESSSSDSSSSDSGGGGDSGGDGAAQGGYIDKRKGVITPPGVQSPLSAGWSQQQMQTKKGGVGSRGGLPFALGIPNPVTRAKKRGGE